MSASRRNVGALGALGLHLWACVQQPQSLSPDARTPLVPTIGPAANAPQQEEERPSLMANRPLTRPLGQLTYEAPAVVVALGSYIALVFRASDSGRPSGNAIVALRMLNEAGQLQPAWVLRSYGGFPRSLAAAAGSGELFVAWSAQIGFSGTINTQGGRVAPVGRQLSDLGTLTMLRSMESAEDGGVDALGFPLRAVATERGYVLAYRSLLDLCEGRYCPTVGLLDFPLRGRARPLDRIANLHFDGSLVMLGDATHPWSVAVGRQGGIEQAGEGALAGFAVDPGWRVLHGWLTPGAPREGTVLVDRGASAHPRFALVPTPRRGAAAEPLESARLECAEAMPTVVFRTSAGERRVPVEQLAGTDVVPWVLEQQPRWALGAVPPQLAQSPLSAAYSAGQLVIATQRGLVRARCEGGVLRSAPIPWDGGGVRDAG